MSGTGHFENINKAHCAGDYSYGHIGAVGKEQTVSKHRSPPKSTFGTSRREDTGAMYSVFTVKPS